MILISSVALETENEALYDLNMDYESDFSGLPTSKSTGTSGRVTKFARPGSKARCVESASEYMLGGDDVWHLIMAVPGNLKTMIDAGISQMQNLSKTTSENASKAEASAGNAKASESMLGDFVNSYKFLLVSELPESGADKTAYLIPESGGVVRCFVWQAGAWANVGGQDPDLSDYITSQVLSKALEQYVTKSILEENMASTVSGIQKDDTGTWLVARNGEKVAQIPDADLSDYATNQNVNDLLSEFSKNQAEKFESANSSIKKNADAISVLEGGSFASIAQDSAGDYWLCNKAGEMLVKIPIPQNVEVDLSGYYTSSQVDSKLDEIRGAAFQGMTQDDDGNYWFTNASDEKIMQLPVSPNSSTQSTIVTLTNETVVDGEKVLSFSVAVGKSAVISYGFKDSDADFTGTARYSVNGVVVATENITQGSRTWDAGPYLSAGENKVQVRVTDENDCFSSKTWMVSALAVSVTATLNQETIYTVGTPLRITYTPYGSGMDKITHFLVDGEEMASVTTGYSGRQAIQSLTISTHGAHDIDVYVTASAPGVSIQSDTVHFCVAVADPESATPIITLLNRNPSGRIHSTASIQYLVYDPSTETASVTQTADSESTAITVDRTMQTWAYKPRTVGGHELEISCGDTSVSFVYEATELGYDISAITEGLIYDFDPSGRSNAAEDRDVWKSNGISLSVSNGFDWTNGGFKTDEKGNTAFVIKAGCRATIQHNLFGASPKTTGSNAKFIYTVKNTRSFTADVISCISGGIGLSVTANRAELSSEQTSISVPLCEGEETELEFNITSQTKHSEMFLNVQAIPSRFTTYTSTDRLNQISPVPVTIGSDDCDVWLYRAKAYSLSLTDADLMDNYIADAPDADEMVARYERNQITDQDGNIDPDKLAEVMPMLRVIKMRVPRFTTDKEDKVSGATIQHILKGGRAVDNWTAENCMHRGQGTSSNAYGPAARNMDIEAKSGFVFSDGSTSSTYSMTENSIGEKYFNIKLNVASSENMNNAMLQQLYHLYQPYIRDSRQKNPKVRDTMEFHPCAVFVYNESDEVGFEKGKYIFYGCGDFGNSKKNYAAQGLSAEDHPNEVIVELANNTTPCNRFKTGAGIDTDDTMWETDSNPNAPLSFRYIASTCDETAARKAWADVVKWVAATDPVQATGKTFGATINIGGVGYSSDTAEYRKAKFVAEFDQHFASDSLMYHYCFTSFFLMPDNRAKNTFAHCADVTAENPIWDFVFDYDNDTAMGINNEGDLALDFGYEDTDQIDGGNVFNAQDSVLWCNVRDCMADRVQTMFGSLNELWDYSRLISAFSEYTSQRPERLVMADMRRKYIRPYEDLKTSDGSPITMFIPMLNGTKELQRKYFLKYQCPYMASKFNSAAAKNDKITLRGFSSPDGSRAAVTITPYADLYVSALFGSILLRRRCKRGESVTLSLPEDIALNDTETYIFSASMLAEVEGIESIYTNQIDFSQATKLRRIIIGSDADEYSNTNLKSTTVVDFSALAVLEELRIDHCPNLTAPVDVSGCVALKVASFKGTPVSAVNFAAGGALEECYLESPVSLTLRNMQNIKKFDVTDNYASLTGLRHENTPFPAAYDIVNAAAKLYTARLVGIDWQLTGTEILNRLLAMGGYDENGLEVGQSSLSGKVYTSVIRQSEVESYAAAWPDLSVTYGGTVQQYKVTFCDDDGTTLTLKNGSPAEFLVDRGADCSDPVTSGLMDTPAKDSTQAEVFTYAGWDSSLTQVLSNLTVKATYTSVPQQYTVRWYAQTGVMVGSKTVDYDTEALPPENPERTDEESSFVYYLFDGWNKSTAHVKEDMDVYANWIRGTLPNFGDDLSNLNLAQLYGIRQSGRASLYFTEDEIKTRIPFTMGYEPQFDNVESVLLAENMELNGSTSKDTGVKIMDEDAGWTLIVDCVFDQPTSEACVAACFTKTGYHGFKVKYSSGTAVQWGTNTANNSSGTGLSTISGIGTQCISDQYRELIVLRHVKGSRNLFVYFSNPNGDAVLVRELTKTIDTKSDATLMLGCDNDGKNFATGFLYRCKLWKEDLGENECLKMAAWPREESYLEVVSTGGAIKTNGGTTAIDLIHAGLLNGCHRMNPTNSNEGGWPASEMRKWLQNRYLSGLPAALSRMLASVHISSVDYGAGTAGILESEDKVYLPSMREMNGSTQEPFAYCGEHIPWFTSDRTRIKFAGYTLVENPTYTVSSTAPSNPQKGDVWIYSNVGYLWNGHAWVVARWYWLRDTSVSNSTHFYYVNTNGNVSTNHNATSLNGVLPRLHL